MNIDSTYTLQHHDRVVTQSSASGKDFGARPNGGYIMDSISFSAMLENALKAEFKKG